MMRIRQLCLPFALVACGGGGSATVDAPATADAPKTVDAKTFLDAPSGAFACAGQPLPTTAPDPVTVAGTAQTLNGLSTLPADGVVVAGYLRNNATALISATTPADGSFSLLLATSGAPIDAYLKATKTGLLDYYLYPGTPLAANISGAPALVLSPSSLTTVEGLASVTPAANPSQVGLVGVVLHDCAGMPVAGATIQITEAGNPVGDMRYVAGSLPSTTATTTDSKGAAFVFNVPAGTAIVSATVGSVNLRSVTIPIAGGATHATVLVP